MNTEQTVSPLNKSNKTRLIWNSPEETEEVVHSQLYSWLLLLQQY